MKRRRVLTVATVVAVAVALALVVGSAVGRMGVPAVLALVGAGLAAAAFIDLRITLLAIVPAMVLLPELPFAVPVRTEDLLMVPLAAAFLGQVALGRVRWPSTPLNAPLIAIVAIELVALLWGALRGTTTITTQLYSAGFFFLKTVEVTLLYFIVISAIRSQRDVRRLTFALCGAAVVLGLWGVIERGGRAAAEAIIGPTGHNGYSLLGLTLVVLLATFGALIVTQADRRTRMALVLAAIPVGFALMFTFSRQSYVGAVAAIAVIVWVRDRRLIVLAALAALVLPLLMPEVVQERALSIVTGAPDPVAGISPYATRFNAIYRRLPEVLGTNPFLGLGLAALPPGFLDNQYLLTLYYTGLVGLAIFLWLLWRAWTTALTNYRAAEDRSLLRGLSLAWLAATAGLAIAGLGGSPFVAVRVRQVYWFLAALAVGAKLLTEREGSREEPELEAAQERAA